MPSNPSLSDGESAFWLYAPSEAAAVVLALEFFVVTLSIARRV